MYYGIYASRESTLKNVKTRFAINSVSNLQKNNAIYRTINYFHAIETSRSVFCIFGVGLLLERKPMKTSKWQIDSSSNPCDSGSVTLLFLHCQ